MKHRPLVVTTFLTLLLIVPVSAGKAPSTFANPPLIGSAFPISSAPQYQECAVVVYNATANEYLVVWQDARNGYDIYAQRVSAAGTLLGENFAIAQADGYQLGPVVAWNASGNEYLVAWTDMYASADIYVQRIAANGTLIGSQLPISTATDNQMVDALVWNSTGNEYLIVWSDYRNSTPTNTSSDLYGQRLGSDGISLGSYFVISQAALSQSSADVTWNATNNEYLVVWQDGRHSLGAPQIFGRRLAHTGEVIGAEVAMPSTSYSQYSPVVTWNANANEYLVAWTDDHYALGPYNIFAQRLSASAGLLGASIAVTDMPFEHGAPDLVYNNSTDEYVVVWSVDRSGSSGRDVYAQRIAHDGALVDGEIPIATSALNEASPSLTLNTQANEHLVVWNGYRDDSQWDIYGQRMSGFGPPATSTPSPSPTQTPTPSATVTPTATATAIAPNGRDVYLPLVAYHIPPTPTATQTPTRTPVPLPAGIFGKVTYKGSPAPYIHLTLWFWNGTSWSSVSETNTAADGSYLFGSVASLGNGQVYQVRYGPNTSDTRYLGVWYCPYVEAYSAGTRARGGDFDIANVVLQSPATDSTLRLPVTFTWQRRGLSGDAYRWILSDPDSTDRWYADVGNAGSYKLVALPSGMFYNKRYRWYMEVYSATDGYGVSRYAHGITFVP